VKHMTQRLFGLMLIATIFVFSPVAVIAQSPTARAATPSEPAMRDGQHDFDFSLGTWKTHITRLQKPLSGSTTWIKLEGTKTERKIWNGRAHLEEIEADGPTGHMEGLTLFLYNPQAHQWNQTFASSRDGALGAPKFEQAFSNDGGKTWETNFIALLTREKNDHESGVPR
jgi:hypothetical protein